MVHPLPRFPSAHGMGSSERLHRGRNVYSPDTLTLDSQCLYYQERSELLKRDCQAYSQAGGKATQGPCQRSCPRAALVTLVAFLETLS